MSSVRPPLLPLLKWAGGKRSEIPYLKSSYPSSIQRIIEPFSGGAAVSFDLNADQVVLNDLSKGLVDFYQTMQNQASRKALMEQLVLLDALRKRLKKTVSSWSEQQLQDFFHSPQIFIENHAKTWAGKSWPSEHFEVLKKDWLDQAQSKTQKRIPALEKKHQMVFSVEEKRNHAETALQAGLYTALRRIYNAHLKVSPALSTASWWMVRALCYSGMFRYSKKGEFNVPYGGIAYNTRDFTASIAHLQSQEIADFFSRTKVYALDFEVLLKSLSLTSNDFLFIDPPYDSNFSQYNPDEGFGQDDQKRLAKTLKSISSPWMLVIKNTPFILSLYQDKSLHRAVFAKTYGANFRNRHSRDVEHLVVSNYPLTYAKLGENGLLPLDQPSQ